MNVKNKQTEKIERSPAAPDDCKRPRRRHKPSPARGDPATARRGWAPPGCGTEAKRSQTQWWKQSEVQEDSSAKPASLRSNLIYYPELPVEFTTHI